MKLTIEISTATHIHTDDEQRPEFSVQSYLGGLDDWGKPESCWSYGKSAELQAIGTARLIDLDRKIRELVEDYSQSSSPRDWRICKNSSKEQNVEYVFPSDMKSLARPR